MRIGRLSTVLLGVLLVAGCASQQESVGPDLEAPKADADQRIQAVDATENSILADLDRLEKLHDDLGGLVDRIEGRELPFSLLRLVAMNCLNTEYDGSAAEVVDLGGRPLTCRPAHIDGLLDMLAEYPTAVRDDVYDLLYALDQARLLRGSLRHRMARLPGTLEEHAEFIADERARLRQMESDLEQERNVYSTRQWRQVNDRLDEYRELLDELEGRIEQVARDSEDWPERIDDLVTTVYFDLAYLRGSPQAIPTE